MSSAQATVSAPAAIPVPAVAADYHAPKKGPNWKSYGRHLFLIIMCLWVLLPIIWVVLLSFKTLQDGARNYIWPQNGFIDPILTNYDYVLNNPRKVGPVITLFKNSVLVTGLTVVAATVTSVLAGYALVHMKTPAARILTALLVASMFFPTQVTAIIGIFNIQKSLGLINQT